jgi:PKD repeat protein
MNGKINSWGIYLANCSYNPDQYNLISNNFITQTSQPTSTTTGMMIIDVPRTDILNNTINIIGAAGSQALKVSASPIDIIKIQYNILINKGAGGYCINLSDPGFATTPNIQTCDYNSYWFGAGVRIGYHSAFSAFVDISLWRTNLGFDNNSIVYDPVFVDPLNLHLKCPSLALKKANASPVSYDIDGDVRGSLNYIGADEYRGAQINATSDTICSFLNQAAQNGYTDLHAISVEKTGFWTKLDNGWPGAFSLTNSSNTNLTGLDLNKDYRVLWTINEPQGFQTVDTIVVCTLTSIAGNDQTICSLTGQLSGNNLSAFGAKGKWSDHAAIVSLNYTSLNNATYTFSSSGYSSPFTWTFKKNQCSSSDIVTISNEQLTATIDASDLATGLPLLGGPHYTTCTAYAQLGLTAKDFNNNDVTGELDQINWTLVGGGGSITNPNASNVIVSNITNMTTIHWFIKRGGANGCIAEGNVYVHNKLPFANAGPDKPLCQDNIKLVANQPKTDENGHWSIDPYNSGYNIIDNIISPSINVTNLFPGSVTFTWTVTNGICTASDETTVTNNIGKSAVINKSITLPICTNSVEIIANDISGNWTSTNPQITFDNSLSSHTFVRNLQTGINMLKWKVAVGTCVSEDTYTIASNFVPHFAGNDQILCNANSTNLTAQNPSPGTGYWTASDSPTPVSPTNPLSAINGLFHGFNSYSWTVANNGCTWTEYVNINNIFVQAIVSIPTQICTTNVIIKANNPGVATGAWSYVGSGNPNIVYINEPTTEVVNLNPGIHTFKWTVNQSVCTANASANVEYTQLVATANSNVSIVCNNSTISLIGNPFPTGGTGRWFDELGNAPILNPNSPTAYATPNLSASNYQFKWEIIKGICKNSKTLILNNNTPSLASANANPISVCYNMSDLSATNPSIGTGKWVPLTSGASIVSPSSYITSTQTLALGPNKFRWTVDNQGCMSYQDVIVTKNAGVTAFAGNDKSVCSSTFTLQANQPIVGQGYWSGAVGGNVKITNSQLYNSQITGLQPEIAQVLRWTIAGTCSGELASDDVRIIYKQPSTASAYSNKTFTCLGSDVVLTAQSPTIGTGSWSTIKGNGTFNNPNGLVTGVSGLSLGENIFRWTVYYFGCTSSIDITIYNDMVTANAGPDKIVCKPEAALEATPILQGVGRWSSTGNLILFDKPESNNSNVKNLIKGANFLVWTVTKGNCSAMDEVKILNDQVITYAGSDQKICTDATVLDAKLPLTAEYGTWSGVGSIQFDNRQKNNTPIKSIPIGKNTLIWSVSNQNCSIKDTVVIINNSVKAEVAQQSQTVCSPEARISAKAPSQGIGQWSKDNTITSAIISNPIDLQTYTTGLSQGINRFIWRVVLEECISSTSTMVVNNQLFANAGQDQITCQDVTDLAAVKPVRGTGIWTTRQGSGYASQPGLINSPVVKLVNGQNIFVWTISDGQCVSSDEVLINNMKVTANAGQDQVLCESKTTMAADEPGYGFGKWTSNTSLTFLNSEYKNTTVSGLAQGANILKWTVSNSYCSTFDEVIITNNEVKADAGKDNNGCSATAILQAVAPVVGTGKWTAIGNAKIDLPDNYLITVSNLTYGENQFVWTVTNQNCSAYDVAIAGNWGLKADAGADFEVCSSDSYLPAVMPLDGVYRNWLSDPVVVVADRSNPKSYIMSLKPGENKFVWNIYNNYCSSSDEVIIRNNAVSAFAGDDKILCTDSVKLSAIIPIQGQGKWSVKNGSGTFDNELLNNAFVRKLGFGQNRFVWTVSLGKCLASDEVIITNNKVKAELLSAENQTICTNAGNLNAKTPSSGTGSWSSSQKNKITNPNSPVTPVTNLVQGMNNFYWRVINEQCVDELKIILNNKSVYANAGQDQIICTDSTFMKAIQSGSPGYWEKISGYADFADLLSPISKIKNVRQGENRFRWNVINDKCYASDEVVITNRTVSVTADANLTVCKADASLKAIVKGSGSGNWSIVYGGGTPSISTQTNTAVTNLSRGNNLFVYTYSNESCSAFDDIMISNNSFIINAGEDLTLCSNTTLLNGQDFYPQTGTWEVVSGAAKFVNPKDGKTKVEQLGYGSNKLRWTMEYRGCKNSDEVIINNAGLNPTMISKILNGNTNTVEFTANVSGQYDKLLWDFADGRSSEIKNPVHVFQLPKEYNVCLTAKNSKFGCVEMVCSKVNLNFATLTADYSFTVDKLTLAVKFTDKSLSNTTITKWNWAFGDLGTSLEQNPTFKFTKEGNYFVCLTIENQAGFKTYICKTIEVKKQNCNLVADFYMVKDEATKKIQLFDISQGNANQWNWTFGDGNTSDQRNPVYTYNEVKEYEIILKIQENSTGCFSEKSRTVRFGEIICKAEFNAIINPNSTSVKFENFSKAATGTGIKTYYHWVFGDGGESSETAPTHAYLKDGFYDVILVLKNEGSVNCEDYIMKKIMVGNPGCAADFTYLPVSGTEVKFINQSVGQSEIYNWYFGDGSSSTAKDVTHVFPKAGIYTVKLTIGNQTSNCYSEKEKLIIVDQINIDCEAEFVYQTDPVNMIGKFYNASIGSNLSFTWSFGDEDYSYTKDAEHKYDANKVYNVCLTAYNQFTQKTTCKNVPLLQAAQTEPTLIPDFGYLLVPGTNKVVFFDKSTGNTKKWDWEFGDSKLGSGNRLEHLYDKPNYYLVHLKVTDTKNISKDIFKLVNVNMGDGWFVDFGFTVPSNNTKKGGYPVNYISATWGTPAKAVWNFGDGTKDSTSLNPIYGYKSAGTYHVCFEASDPVTGQSGKVCKDVTISTTGIWLSENLQASLINFPNPFNDVTHIIYSLPKATTVTLAVFDILGNKVVTLVDEQKSAGSYSTTLSKQKLEIGVYFLQFETPQGKMVNKIIITE